MSLRKITETARTAPEITARIDEHRRQSAHAWANLAAMTAVGGGDGVHAVQTVAREPMVHRAAQASAPVPASAPTNSVG